MSVIILVIEEWLERVGITTIHAPRRLGRREFPDRWKRQ